MYTVLKLQIVSIHAPRAGGDGVIRPSFQGFSLFQSTPPARGATNTGAESTVVARFNPPPARGATSQPACVGSLVS